MRRQHDAFLKLLYRTGARDAVGLFFPDLAAEIDWSRLQWVEKEVPILGERRRSVVADLVGLTRDVHGNGLQLLIHPEIQAGPDTGMGWRVLQYNAGLTLQQANPNARVLTVVFYHCRGVGGVGHRRHCLEFGGHSVLEVGYWSVGLGDLEAESYAESDNPIAWALASWMRQQKPGRVMLRLSLLGRILRSVPDEFYRWLLLDAVRTYFCLSHEEEAEEQRLLKAGPYEEIREMYHTYDTELGRVTRKALREGERRGRQEGEQDALRRALLAVLDSRFPPLPDSVQTQIREMEDLAALSDLIRRASTAGSLDEVLGTREQ